MYTCETGSFDVTPDLVNLRGGKPVNFKWELPDGAAFCGDDAVYLNPGLTVAPRQITESFGSNDDLGTRGSNEMVAKTCSTRWHWPNYRNEGTATHKYTIQFTDKGSGRTCVIDPYIRNG
jgi:hypothetical protein